MTAKELIIQLLNIPLNAEVFITHDLGDIIGTTIAIPSRDLELVAVEINQASEHMKIIEDESDRGEIKTRVYVLR